MYEGHVTKGKHQSQGNKTLAKKMMITNEEVFEYVCLIV